MWNEWKRVNVKKEKKKESKDVCKKGYALKKKRKRKNKIYVISLLTASIVLEVKNNVKQNRKEMKKKREVEEETWTKCEKKDINCFCK